MDEKDAPNISKTVLRIERKLMTARDLLATITSCVDGAEQGYSGNDLEEARDSIKSHLCTCETIADDILNFVTCLERSIGDINEPPHNPKVLSSRSIAKSTAKVHAPDACDYAGIAKSITRTTGAKTTFKIPRVHPGKVNNGK